MRNKFRNESNGNSSLLTYSTPVYFGKPLSAFIAYDLAKQGINIPKKTPRVNFHSIEDIVYGGDTSKCNESIVHNDSGFSSFHDSKSFSPVVEQKNDAEEYASDIDEDKENNTSDSKKTIDSKKVRTTFTEEQKKALDVYFRKNPYPDPKETEELSHHLSLPENVIKVWFQNKRSRDKQRKFSTKSQFKNQQQQQIFNTSSPIVNNLQLLSSRINSYMTMANFHQHAHNFF